MTLVDGTVVRAKDVTGGSTKGRKVLELMDSFISYYLLFNVSMIPQLLYYFLTYLLFLNVSKTLTSLKFPPLRKLVYVGDTSDASNLIKEAMDCDILIHEATGDEVRRSSVARRVSQCKLNRNTHQKHSAI